MNSAYDYVRTQAERFKQEMVDLLKIPSVSTEPQHARDVERAAAWLTEQMRSIGLSRAEIFQQAGYLPLVYGEWLGAGTEAPTVLVYCHYDVQPASIEDGWHSDPFQPVERDGRLYARGAVDSKSHVIIHLKAVEAMLASEEGCPVNIKLLFEGEEESGSEHIFAFVAEHTELLKADVCIISDGSLPQEDQPVINYGLRGIVSLEVEVQGPQRDLHSGHFGGIVHNPIQALIEILAKLHDEQGHVTVPGFYDEVRPLDPEERQLMADSLYLAEAEFNNVAAAPMPWGEPEYNMNERIGARPTLEFNGIAGGYYGEGTKTVLPQRAFSKITCRLVPDQDPDKIYNTVRDAILSLSPPTVRVSVKQTEAGAPGILIDRDNVAMQSLTEAYEQIWGKRPLLRREGGSVPVIAAFIEHLNIPIAPMPFGYKGGGAHGPNEYVVMSMFYKGIETMIYFCHDFRERSNK